MLPIGLASGRHQDSPSLNIPAVRVNIVAVLILLLSAAAGIIFTAKSENPLWLFAAVIIGLILAQSPKVAKQWERAVVLRLGKYRGLEGPGLFWIVPFVDTISLYIDQRVVTTSFAAEETLTSDTVPVNVDAVLFWMVHDSEKAALEVQDYAQAVSWAAQTGLRDIIGRTSLSDLLRGREKIEAELQALIDQRSNPWGSPCSQWRCATSSFRHRFRTRCHAKRRRRARSRRASSSARRRSRSPISSARRRSRIRTIRPRCIFAR